MINKVFFAMLTIFFCSCTDQNDNYINYDFKIVNNSGKDIVINSYDFAELSLVRKTIIIENNSFYFESRKSKESDTGFNLSDILDGNYVIINYNNERQEIFSCIDRFNTAVGCAEERNILNYYISTSSGNNINTTYTITSTDYDNAND